MVLRRTDLGAASMAPDSSSESSNTSPTVKTSILNSSNTPASGHETVHRKSTEQVSHGSRDLNTPNITPVDHEAHRNSSEQIARGSRTDPNTFSSDHVDANTRFPRAEHASTSPLRAEDSDDVTGDREHSHSLRKGSSGKDMAMRTDPRGGAGATGTEGRQYSPRTKNAVEHNGSGSNRDIAARDGMSSDNISPQRAAASKRSSPAWAPRAAPGGVTHTEENELPGAHGVETETPATIGKTNAEQRALTTPAAPTPGLVPLKPKPGFSTAQDLEGQPGPDSRFGSPAPHMHGRDADQPYSQNYRDFGKLQLSGYQDVRDRGEGPSVNPRDRERLPSAARYPPTREMPPTWDPYDEQNDVTVDPHRHPRDQSSWGEPNRQQYRESGYGHVDIRANHGSPSYPASMRRGMDDDMLRMPSSRTDRSWPYGAQAQPSDGVQMMGTRSREALSARDQGEYLPSAVPSRPAVHSGFQEYVERDTSLRYAGGGGSSRVEPYPRAPPPANVRMRDGFNPGLDPGMIGTMEQTTGSPGAHMRRSLGRLPGRHDQNSPHFPPRSAPGDYQYRSPGSVPRYPVYEGRGFDLDFDHQREEIGGQRDMDYGQSSPQMSGRLMQPHFVPPGRHVDISAIRKKPSGIRTIEARPPGTMAPVSQASTPSRLPTVPPMGMVRDDIIPGPGDGMAMRPGRPIGGARVSPGSGRGALSREGSDMFIQDRSRLAQSRTSRSPMNGDAVGTVDTGDGEPKSSSQPQSVDLQSSGGESASKKAANSSMALRRRCRAELSRDWICSEPYCAKRYQEWRSLQYHLKAVHKVRIVKAEYEAMRSQTMASKDGETRSRLIMPTIRTRSEGSVSGFNIMDDVDKGDFYYGDGGEASERNSYVSHPGDNYSRSTARGAPLGPADHVISHHYADDGYGYPPSRSAPQSEARYHRDDVMGRYSPYSPGPYYGLPSETVPGRPMLPYEHQQHHRYRPPSRDFPDSQ